MTRNSILIVIILLLTAILWVGSGFFVPREKKTDDTHAAQKIQVEKDRLTNVEIRASQSKPHRRKLTLSAVTQPSKRSEIKAEVTGKVELLPIKEGQKVQKGDVLMKIEVRDTGANVAEAKAAKAQVQLDYDAAQKLNARGLAADTAVARAKASLEAANARLIAARTQYNNTTITSPITGVVQSVAVELGDVVGPNFRTGSGSFNDASSLISIIADEGYHVVADISEQYVSDVKIGQPATVLLYTQETVEGVVGFVSSVADSVTRTFALEVHLPADVSRKRLVSGASATIELLLSEEQAHHIPTSYLSLHKGDLGIKVLNINEIRDDAMIGTVAFLPINMNDNDREGVWVTSLPEQVEIITLGQGFVSPGDTVRAVRYEAKAAAGDA